MGSVPVVQQREYGLGAWLEPCSTLLHEASAVLLLTRVRFGQGADWKMRVRPILGACLSRPISRISQFLYKKR